MRSSHGPKERILLLAAEIVRWRRDDDAALSGELAAVADRVEALAAVADEAPSRQGTSAAGPPGP